MEKKTVLKCLQGYKLANKIMEKERKKRLSLLSHNEAILQYDELCQSWDYVEKKELKKLDKQKFLFLVNRRRLLNKTGKLILGK